MALGCGIVMPAIYIIVYYEAGLYADFAINIYYLIASIYGVACWLGHRDNAEDNSDAPVRRTRLNSV